MTRWLKWGFILVAGLFIIWKVQNVMSTKSEVPDPQLLAKDGVCLGLNYHRIKSPNLWNKTIEIVSGSDHLTRYNVYEDEFKDQITWMKQQGVHFATAKDISEYVRGNPIPDKCVWISFDDVDHTVYENAFPILIEEQVPFTLFVITGHVGERFQNLELSTWDELREMNESGLADFGSHTHDFHYIQDGQATFLDPAQHEAFREDLQTSRDTLQQELGLDVTTIAYPFGETDDAVTAIAQSAGYTDAFILSPNPITNENSSLFINRYLLDRHLFSEFVKPYLLNEKQDALND